MAWLYLILAGLFETVWVVSMKYSEGFSRFWPSFATIVVMAISVYFLSLAMKTLPLGTSYAVWTAIGTLGAVIFGMQTFGESKSLLKILFLAMIVGGIGGLKALSDRESATKKTEQSQPVRTETESGDHPPANS